MRHNISLSYRSVTKLSLVLLLFFLLSIIPVLPAYSQDNPDKSPVVNNTPGSNNNSNAVPGQGFVEEDFKPQVEEESVAWMIIKTILILGLFAGGFYMFFKFVSQKAGLHVSGHEAIQILSTVSVGTNKFVQIIDVAGKVFLLGVSDSSINLLTEITDREEIDRIRLLSSRSTPVQNATFPEFIASHIGWVIDKINEKRTYGLKKTAIVEEISQKDFDMSYLNKQKKRLKNIDGGDDE